MAKILISTPTYNYGSHARMVGSLIGELQTLRGQGHHANWNYIVSSALAWARNTAVDMAIKDGYDWLFFWDADVSIDKQGFIEEMITLAQEKNAGIVGVPYAMKGFPIEYACRALDGTRIVADVNATHDTKAVMNLPTEPFQASQVATGTMLIKVDVLKQMQGPWFTFIDKIEDGVPIFWPEDYNFCDLAAKHCDIWADPRYKTMHWGQFAFM